MEERFEHGAETDSGGSAPVGRAGETVLRDVFHAFELAQALSHFDLGVIESIREYPRGSPNSPKALLKTERGIYLLKRLAPGRDDLNRLAFAHGVQLRLIQKGFPAPRLIGTRRENDSMLRMRGRVYELYEFVLGAHFDHSVEATRSAGRELGALHALLAHQRAAWTPPAAGYHNIRQVGEQLETLAAHLHRGQDLQAAASRLAKAYRTAADQAETIGVDEWETQIIHGDWHPGNLLFHEGDVAAVFDFDTLRTAPRALDVANGALQFSLTRGGEDPAAWPESLDEDRYLAFFQGYHDGVDHHLTPPEAEAVPHLMIEALIVEAAAPVAATGSFDRYEGEPFLQMIVRKVEWLESRRSWLSEAALNERT